METSKQNQWIGSNAKDTFFNATLVTIALLVVVAQAVISGEVESQGPRHEAATATARAHA